MSQPPDDQPEADSEYQPFLVDGMQYDCDGCGFPAQALKEYPAFSIDRNAPKIRLCLVCANTLTWVPTREQRMIAWGINYLALSATSRAKLTGGLS